MVKPNPGAGPGERERHAGFQDSDPAGAHVALSFLPTMYHTEEFMADEKARNLADERREKRSGGGTRADRAERARLAAEESANERSIIPGPRSFAGESIASTEEEQTRDHTTRRGSGPQDDVQASDRIPPKLSDEVDRKD